MSDVERYITDEALTAANGAWVQWFAEGPHDTDATGNGAILRAALPGILAQHRADVLREAADVSDVYNDSTIHNLSRRLRKLAKEADEAVGDE